MKIVLKVIGYILLVLSLMLLVYFLFQDQGSGIENLKDLFSNGFVDGIRQFFTSIWNGFKFVCGID